MLWRASSGASSRTTKPCAQTTRQQSDAGPAQPLHDLRESVHCPLRVGDGGTDDRLPAFGDHLRTIPLLEPAASARAATTGALRVGEQLAERPGERRRLLRRHQPAGLRVEDDLRDAAHAARDDRHPGDHRLEDDQGHPLVDRRHDQRRRALEQPADLARAPAAEKVDLVADRETHRGALDRLPVLALADDAETRACRPVRP